MLCSLGALHPLGYQGHKCGDVTCPCPQQVCSVVTGMSLASLCFHLTVGKLSSISLPRQTAPNLGTPETPTPLWAIASEWAGSRVGSARLWPAPGQMHVPAEGRPFMFTLGRCQAGQVARTLRLTAKLWKEAAGFKRTHLAWQ
jgi:hypothetical protein